jgi:hypothetical protein
MFLQTNWLIVIERGREQVLKAVAELEEEINH